MIFNKNNFLLTMLFFTGVWNSIAQTKELTIAHTLQSDMVIQQGKPLVVWGKANPDSTIIVKTDWIKESVKTVADTDGGWKLNIPVPLVKEGEFTPHAMEISGSGGKIILQNVLFGDVWLCSGQSNMDMTLLPFLPWLLGAMHYQQEIENANYPQIRLYDVQTNFKAAPQDDCRGEWKICTPETAGNFSALAYFFAREIFNRRKIPIGLVVSSIGASSCEAWTSRETLTKDSALFARYLYPFDTSAQAKEPLDSVVTFEKVVRPTLIYNAMIHPLRNISLSGVLWYQGESNKDDGAWYTRLCSAMINNWRDIFSQKQLPFYYVQVAPYNWQKSDTTAFNYALLREGQDRIRKVLPYVEMALTMDIADPSDIHPRNKQDLGYRLAKIALAKKYQVPGVVYKGPQFERFSVHKDTVKISFISESIGSGLATNDGLEPRHFFVAGKDQVFHDAHGRITGNQVWIASSAVKEPVAIRYAFTNYPVTNFCNQEGFPAEPFRSGF